MTTPTDAMNAEETLARWRAEEAAVRGRRRELCRDRQFAQVVSGSQCMFWHTEIPPEMTRWNTRKSRGHHRPSGHTDNM
jgi:hypothetical protein